MSILLLFLTFTFAAELEVEGDLKVTGNIDAQNNPIKNVGVPHELTDAINGNILQDALRDDSVFEFKAYKLRLNHTSSDGLMYWVEIGSDINQWSSNFIQELNILSLEGYEISHTTQLPYFYDPNTGSSGTDITTGGESFLLIFLKRPIEE